MARVEEDIGIPSCNIKYVSNNRFVCLVQTRWLDELLNKQRVPKLKCEPIRETDKEVLLASSRTNIPELWTKLSIKTIKKRDVPVQRRREDFPTLPETAGFCKTVSMVVGRNKNSEWSGCFNKYGSHLIVPSEPQVDTQEYNGAVRDVLSKLFQCPFISVGNQETASSEVFKSDDHHGICPALCILESSHVFYIVQSFCQHSLHDVVYFSPGALGGCFAKPLFVLYQVLQSFSHCHSLQLPVGNIRLMDILIDKKFWIQLNVPKTNSLADVSTDTGKPAQLQKQVSGSGFPSFDDLPKLTLDWVYHKISNFEYLMLINHLAGRRQNDPNHHPVFPWVMDFTQRNGGYRDLSKSKFRLNKGDALLDLMFESVPRIGNSQVLQNHVKHHISEVLSEITYFVYKARRTPKEILCNHVRTKWVPNEYPSSMQRLQEWTPDECIPEFFTDSSIFTSIHKDLPDLELPQWSSSAEDFIKHHMSVLEGDVVSQDLHSWIDLTFGYKLSGTAAVKYKNVCLQLVDGHKHLSNHGVVQLFEQRHPQRLSADKFFSVIPPQLGRQYPADESISSNGQSAYHRKVQGLGAALQVFGETMQFENDKKDLAGSGDKRPRTDTESTMRKAAIQLPEDFDPLSALKQIEILHSFSQEPLPATPNNKVSNPPSPCVQKVKQDMQVFACLIAELFLSSKFRTLGPGATLEQRFSLVKNICKKCLIDIPSPVRHALSVLVLTNDDDSLLRDQLNIPFATPGFLLNPLTSIIKFPSYFKDLYTSICDLRNIDQKMALEPTSVSHIKEKVQITHKCIEKLSMHKKEEAILMILPYVEEMFGDEKYAIHAIWTLFSPLSLNLDQERTLSSCLPLLLKLFNVDRPSLKHMKYYHRSFLLQLIMRLGLQTFLTHFSTLLVEAVSGYHDYIPTDSTTNMVCDDDFVPQQTPMEIGGENSYRTETNDSERYVSRRRSASENSNDWEQESDSDNELVKSLGKASIRAKLLTKQETAAETGESVDNKRRNRKVSGSGSRKSASSQESVERKEDDQESQESRSRHGSGGSTTSETRSMSPSKISTNSANSHGEVTPTPVLEDTMEEVLHRNGEANICDVASESVRWLAHRLGPLLTAKYLSGNLLRMLALCYLGDDQLKTVTVTADVLSASKKAVCGDWNASKVLMCLSDIALLYGEQIILLQYFKHIVNLLGSTQQRVSARNEAGLVSCAALIHHILPFMSDTVLMNCLEETIFREMLGPMMSRMSSIRHSFPSGSHVRAVVMYKIIDILNLIGLRLGFDMARKMMGRILQQFFLSFDTIYKGTNIAPDVASSPIYGTPVRKDLSRSESEEAFLDIKMDSGTHEYTIGTPVRVESIRSLAGSDSNKFRAYSLSPSFEEEDHSMPVGNKEQILDELRQAFSPQMANTAYIAFCKIVGNIYVDQNMKNYDLIHRLCENYEEVTSKEQSSKTLTEEEDVEDSPKTRRTSWFLPVPKSPKPEVKKDEEPSEISGSFGRNVTKIGNRIALSEDAPRKVSDMQVDTSRLKSPELESNRLRHLRGNWLAYWEHELGLSERETSFNFKQIKLQSFTGHTSSVRAIHVMDNENSFISASKDKTVKLWSLRSIGDGNSRSQCQWTYTSHKKSVFSVAFLESIGLAASCDSTLHLWDPFVGKCLRQFDSSRHSPVTVIAALPTPTYNLIAGTTDATLRFVDVREQEYVHEFRCSVSQAGIIRCLSVSPNGLWVAVGYSSGIISVLDVRTGLVMGVWKGHDNEILQLHAYDNTSFLSSSFDGNVIQWSADDHKQLNTFKGQTDPVHCFDFYRDEIVSITTGNRVGVHTDIGNVASFSSTKLRSDTFKGVLTTMAVLPLNRMLLLGADNGSIKLLC